MTKVNKILKLIESLQYYTEEEILRDHVDTLNEIDARFDMYSSKYDWYEDICNVTARRGGIEYYAASSTHAFGGQNTFCPHKFTRSIEAQQPYVPEGWVLANVKTLKPPEWVACYYRYSCVTHTPSIILPTECLARLHSLIQAIQWERENG